MAIPENGNSNENEAPETPAPDAPAVAVAIAQPAPAPPAEEEPDAELDAIAERIAALEGRITEALNGDETWQATTTSTITSLQQEIANLKASLQQVTEGIPEQITSLRDELTRLSRELQAAREAPPVTQEVQPPAVPPLAESPPQGPVGAPGSTENPPAPHQSGVAKKRRRVV